MPLDGFELSDSENNAPNTMLAAKQSANRRTIMNGTRAVPSGGAVLGSRRAGLMLGGALRSSGGLIKQRATTVASRRQEEEYAMANALSAHIYSNYGDLDDQGEVSPPKPVKTPGHWQPGKRGRPPASYSQKRYALFILFICSHSSWHLSE